MLSEKILNLLNEKINDELYRSNQFLEISGWASDLSLKGVEGYSFTYLQKHVLMCIL